MSVELPPCRCTQEDRIVKIERALFGHQNGEWHDGLTQKVDDLIRKLDEGSRILKPAVYLLVGIGLLNLVTNGSEFAAQLQRLAPMMPK